ncbi:mucin-2-like isoform X7 [Lytechinus pictus]|uniref:mucin-2-like isoform X7 n=1 Tax=Lytechinus pictus TaxID=7653 RepID=UPI0030BA1997
MDSPDDICFKGNSALECNCTSSPPELPPKPSFCIEPCTPPTTTTGTTTETPTTTPGTPPGTTTVMTESPPITTTEYTTWTTPESTTTSSIGPESTTLETTTTDFNTTQGNDTTTATPATQDPGTEYTTWTTPESTTTSSIGPESTTLETTTTDFNTTQGNDTTTTTPDNGSPTTQDAATGTAPIVPSTSDMNSGSTFGGTEIITDIASTAGTTPYDDGTPPVDTSSSATNTGIFTSDGTTFSDPTSLGPTEYTRSDGMTATSSNPPLETFSTGLPNGTSPNLNETTPLISTTETALPTCYDNCNITASPSAETTLPPCYDNCNITASPSAALIAGCVCGAVAIIVLCGILIWYLWKNKKCCFAPVGSRGKNGSKECLADHEENNVELTKVEKKGTVILTPVTNPTVMPGPLPPIPNSEITPVNHPSTEETSPSHSTGSKPGNATSKKKKKLSRSNRVSPEPIPGPTSPKGGGGG